MIAFRLRRRGALPVYLVIEGAMSLFFTLVFTVNMVYQVTVVGLNPLQLVLVGTTLEATVFLFEVPTGVVADTISRRLSIIIGMFVIGTGFVLEGTVPHFAAVLAAQVLWGLGYTFTSGATEAWIADEIGEAQAGQAFLRGSQIAQIGGLAAIPLSVALASVTIQLPIALGGVLFVILGGWLSMTMPETGFRPLAAGERATWASMRRTLSDGVQLIQRSRVVLILVGVAAIAGLHSEGIDRLWTAHFLEDFTLPALGALKPVVWFGIIGAVTRLVSIIATEGIRRRVNLADQAVLARLLLVLTALRLAAWLVFALVMDFWLALGAYWLARTMSSVTYPVTNTWLNQHVASGVRATVFSITSQANAVSQVIGGPIVGAIGTVVSLRAALVTSSLMLSPALGLYLLALRVPSMAATHAPQPDDA